MDDRGETRDPRDRTKDPRNGSTESPRGKNVGTWRDNVADVGIVAYPAHTVVQPSADDISVERSIVGVRDLSIERRSRVDERGLTDSRRREECHAPPVGDGTRVAVNKKTG